MKVVKVFKTDVNDPAAACRIIRLLQQSFSGCRINFDLDDCDRVLRIESQQASISVEEADVRALIIRCGHRCEPLRD